MNLNAASYAKAGLKSHADKRVVPDSILPLPDGSSIHLPKVPQIGPDRLAMTGSA
jgi:hypothetical protein